MTQTEFDASGFLKQNAGLMVRRLTGVALAVVALGVALVVTRSDAESTALATTQTNEAETAKVADAVVVEVLALPTRLSDAAKRAAALPVLVTVFSTNDLNTLTDLMNNEASWAPFRSNGPSGAFIGDTLAAQTGQDVSRSLMTLAAPLAKKAQGGTEASALLLADEKLWEVAAHAGPPTANALPTAIVVAQPLTAEALTPIASSRSAWLELSVGDLKAAPPGATPPTAQTESLAKRVLVNGVDLVVRRNVSDALAQAQAKTDRFRLSAFGLAGLFAALMLAFGFWPKNKEQAEQAALLKQTAEELRQSRVDITNLTNRVTQSGNFAQLSVSPDAAPFSATITTTPSRYQEVMPLGEGGMARVSIAVVSGAEGFRRYFVVKRLKGELAGNTEMVNQFIDEARLTASLVHSNVIPVFDFGRDSLGYFLASEYILGRSVEQLIARQRELHGKGLDPDIVRLIGQEALKALAYAHGKADESGKALGLVHRDVSPANLLVSAQGEVKLLDFGIVKSEARVNKTLAGIVKGNLFYMAPEQAMAQPVDPRADVFSLGLVLFTALTGQTLYQAETVHELLTRGAQGPTVDDVARIAAVPGALGEVLNKAIASNREQRFASAEAFLQALTASGPVASGAALRALVTELVGAELAAETQKLQEAQ